MRRWTKLRLIRGKTSDQATSAIRTSHNGLWAMTSLRLVWDIAKHRQHLEGTEDSNAHVCCEKYELGSLTSTPRQHKIGCLYRSFKPNIMGWEGRWSGHCSLPASYSPEEKRRSKTLLTRRAQTLEHQFLDTVIILGARTLYLPYLRYLTLALRAR
jgi:hypothetical protein